MFRIFTVQEANTHKCRKEILPYYLMCALEVNRDAHTILKYIDKVLQGDRKAHVTET